MTFTETLNWASSIASALENAETPALVVADKIIAGEGSLATVEVIEIIRPHFFEIMPGATALQKRTTLKRLA